jgi:hypothetical protein
LASPFALGEINPTIDLVTGRGVLKGGLEALEFPEVTISQTFTPWPSIQFSGEGAVEPMALGNANRLERWRPKELELPDFHLSAGVQERFSLDGDVRRTPAVLRAAGELRTVETTGAPRLKKLLFHVPNLREFLGETVGDHSAVRSSSCTLKSGSWKVRFDARLDLPRLEKDLSVLGGYAVTHVGELTRPTGHSFEADDAVEFLDSLYWFLSFVRGSWTAAIMCVGETVEGTTWRYFRPANVEPWNGHHSWCDHKSWPLAAKAFHEYGRLWKDPLWNQALKVVIGFYLSANRPRPMQTAIASAQSGLELLGWLRLVETGEVEEEEWTSLAYSGARKLRGVLSLAQIDPTIPHEYRNLARLDPSWEDGPAVVAGVRNQLVHPRMRNGRIGPTTTTLLQTRMLSTRYLEDCILDVLKVKRPKDTREKAET